jgi:hypothetical protein
MMNQNSQRLPQEPALVLTTLDRLRSVAPEIEKSSYGFLSAAFMDEQGFVCVPIQNKGARQVFIVGRTTRGVFNGAVYLRDFLIDGPKSDLYLQPATIVRSPQMGGRAVYLSTIWGNEDEYAVNDWRKVFESFARDGMDRIYFWLSGHFPSRKFPQTYKVDDLLAGTLYDSTRKSRIGTIEDQRHLIQYAHQMGLKFYLGGGLGGWVGTLFLTNLESATFKRNSVGDSGGNQSEESLCPSQPSVRLALIDYYKEMVDALPEADGLYIESADEMGGCQCDLCNKPIDAFGSKQFGQSQISLIQQIMQAIWREHPHVHLAYSVGYNPHRTDPAYYDAIRQMNDSRFEWLETRDSWEFPGPKGVPLPATYFSRQMLAWKYHDRKRLDQMVSDFNRMAKEGWYGAASVFSPGFSSGSFYNEIPLPTDQLPYVLTHFVHREATWEPALGLDPMRKRVQQRFFGAEAQEEELGNDLWDLREVISEASAGVWDLNTSKQWDYLGCKALPSEKLARIAQIEQHLLTARAGASPKTMEGLNLLAHAIDNLRKYCR